jgi:hypothetical protein
MAFGDDIGGTGFTPDRVNALDVLVSVTLCDLMIELGLGFEERGAHEPRGGPATSTPSPSFLRRRDPAGLARIAFNPCRCG